MTLLPKTIFFFNSKALSVERGKKFRGSGGELGGWYGGGGGGEEEADRGCYELRDV